MKFQEGEEILHELGPERAVLWICEKFALCIVENTCVCQKGDI